MTRQKMNYKYFFLIFSIFSFYLSAEAAELRFRIKDQVIIVRLDDAAWDHITKGQEGNGSYNGGHDWKYYFPKYIKGKLGSKAYYDRNTKAFIVDSTKGDDLSTIINSLKNGNSANYHTLFPPNVLTKDFVLNSFKRAFLTNTLNQIKKGNTADTNLNHNQELFYAEHEGFLVAGRFRRCPQDGVYIIKTFYPDLSWYYRIDFKHHAQDPFSLDRFYSYHPGTGIWVHHGTAKKEIMNPESIAEYLPGNIARLSLQLSDTGDGQRVTPQQFVVLEQLEKYLKHAPIGGDETPSKNILDFFFDDPETPTQLECQNLARLLKYTVPNFQLPVERSSTLESIEQRINTLIGGKRYIHFLHRMVNKETGIVDCIVKQTIFKNATVGMNHFADEIAHLMLNYNTASYFKPNDYLDDDWLYELSHKFYRNFRTYFITDEGALMMEENDLIFDLRFTSKLHCPYALSFSSVKDITSTSFINQDQTYKMLYAFRGSKENPYNFSISCIIYMLMRDYK